MSNISNIGGIPVTLRDPSGDPGQEGRPGAGKKHELAVDKTGRPRSRSSLRMSAGWWRSLQYIGSSFHYLAPPWPPKPASEETIPSTLSSRAGRFKLHFYVPPPPPPRSPRAETGHPGLPAVINFHGGGFTLGSGLDDARFARFVVETCGAVFVSVDYRLAPEYPFPTAVEDGADALLYVIRNAPRLGIDASRIATSGFSAGGNLAITSLLRLAAYLQDPPPGSPPVPDHNVVAMATWYPITDYTITRAERRRAALHPKKALPSNLTDLFDSSYLYPPDLDLNDPYLSPSKATDDQLARAIPTNVIFYTCEWDMLLREGEALAKRLSQPPLNKRVSYSMIPGVPHGWDKGPNPLTPPERSEELYRACCEKLREAFDAA